MTLIDFMFNDPLGMWSTIHTKDSNWLLKISHFGFSTNVIIATKNIHTTVCCRAEVTKNLDNHGALLPDSTVDFWGFVLFYPIW